MAFGACLRTMSSEDLLLRALASAVRPAAFLGLRRGGALNVGGGRLDRREPR